MAFVFSLWYIVALVLVLGIAASLYVYFRMDKQDKILINNFVKEAQEQSAPAEEKAEEKVEVQETETK